METKEMKIVPPEGYEIDTENSTFECIKFKKKSLTYVDVARTLFGDKTVYCLDNGDAIVEINDGSQLNNDRTNATSKKQLEKLLAINKLMNVAKHLNGDWKPDWDDHEESKFYIFIDGGRAISITYCFLCPQMSVYFKTVDHVQKAINILGEDTIRLALSTDW